MSLEDFKRYLEKRKREDDIVISCVTIAIICIPFAVTIMALILAWITRK